MAVLSHDGSRYDREAAGQANLAPRAAAAQAFYQTHSDAYDFLIVFPTFAADFGSEVLGLETGLRNDVAGIGLTVHDDGELFGSTRRLRGYIDVSSLMPNTFDASADGALSIIAHEVLHAWGARLHFRDPGTGQTSNDLLGESQAHWSYYLNTDASVMYGSNWASNVNGSFSSLESRKRYSDLDLYSMGFLAPQEVGPIQLLQPAASTSAKAADLPPPNGTVIAASARTLGIADIIAAEGPRIPSADTAPHAFRAAFALLVAPGQQPTAVQIAFVEAARRAWANEFFFLTRGRGVMETELVNSVRAQGTAAPGTQAGLNYLMSQQTASGSWVGVNGTAFRDTQTAIEAIGLFPGDARGPSAISAAAGFLATCPTPDADSTSRRTLGLSSAHAPLDPDGALSRLLAARRSDGGIGLTLGYGTSVIDTALGASAFFAAGYTAASLELQRMLVAVRNSDGGWPYVVGGPSRIESTVRVLDFLSMRGFDAQQPEVINATSFLHARQQGDGAFADDLSSASATSLSLIALLRSQRLTANDARRALAWLSAAQLPDGSWAESAYQTAQALKALRFAQVSNLEVAFDDVMLSTSRATDGETLVATVLVHNSSPADCGSFQVRLYDSNGIPFGAAQIAAPLAAGARTSLIFQVDTTGHSSSTQLFAVVDPDGAIDETRKDDNRVAVPLEIVAPPSGIDLFVAVGSVSATPGAIDQVGKPIVVTALVGNLGGQDAPAAQVVLQIQGVSVAATTVTLSHRATQLVTFTVSVPLVGGTLPLSVIINPAGLVPEIRLDNNAVSLMVPVVPTVDLAPGAISVSPASVAFGADVGISFTVRNTGTRDIANALIAISILDANGATIAVLPGVRLTIASGGQAAGSAVWHSSRAGTQTIVVRAAAPNDPTPGDDVATASVIVTPSTLPNLQFATAGVEVSPNPPLVGQPAVVTAVVINNGASAAGSFAVDVFLGDPAAGGTRFIHQSITGLAAGTRTTVSGTFTASSPDALTIIAIADPDNQVVESTKSDNSAALTVTPRALPDLVLTDADLRPQTFTPRQDALVSVVVTVQNGGGQPAAQVPVELFLGSPETGGTLIGLVTMATVPAAGSAAASFNFSAVGLTGTQQLFAVANRSQKVVESNYSNNRGSVTLSVQNGAVALSNPFFSPNGDGVQDTTTIFYRGARSAPAEARIAAKDGSVVRTLQDVAGSGNFSWDGLGDTGAVVPDGEYQCSIWQGATVLGAATAVVDTNSLPLSDALGTPLVRDLSINSYEPYFAEMPDGSGIVFNGYDRGQCSLLFSPSGTTDIQSLTPPNWECPDRYHVYGANPDTEIAVSGDGRQIVFGIGPISFDATGSLATFDRQTMATTTLIEFTDRRPLSRRGKIIASPTQSVVLVERQNGSFRDLDALDITTGIATTLTICKDSPEYHFSPDGSSIACTTGEGSRIAVVRPDGTGAHIAFTLPSNRGLLTHSFINPKEVLTYMGTSQEQYVAFNAETGAARPVVLDDGFTLNTYSEMLVSPGGDYVAVTNGELFLNRHQFLGFFLLPLSGAPARLVEPFDQIGVLGNAFRGGGENVKWARSGGALSFADATPDPYSYEKYGGHLHTIVTLENLFVNFGAGRVAGGDAISFRGTVSDRNFDSYTLSYRPWHSTTPAIVFARANQQVIDGSLGQWVPPGPGLYEVFLTAQDKAGNVRTLQTTVAWSEAEAIANVQSDLQYLSPNGDGVQDAALVSYSAVQPTSVEFIFSNEAGNIVRRIDRTHTQPGNASFVWDGLNDAGGVVPDGKYAMQVQGFSLPFVVDTTPPRVEMGAGVGPGQDTKLAFVTLGVHKPDGSPILVDVAVFNFYETSADANFSDWTMQSAVASQSASFIDRKFGTYPGLANFWEYVRGIRGTTFRAKAVDLAGNSTTSATLVVPEQIVVTGVGDPSALDPYISGVLTSEIGTWPRLDLLQTLADKNAVIVLKPHMGIAFESTVNAPFVSFAVAHRPQGTREWTIDTANVNALGEGALEWDPGALTVGSFDVEVRATDTYGRTFASPFHADFQPSPLESNLEVCTSAGPKSLTFLATSNIPGQVTSATLTFTRAADQIREQVLPIAFGTPVTVSLGLYENTASLRPPQLTACAYQVELNALTPSGYPVHGSVFVDLCGLHLLSLSPATGSIVVGESFNQTVVSVDVFERQVMGAWTNVGSLPGFVGRSPTTQLALPVQTTCEGQLFRLLAHLADGSTFDSNQPGNFRSCTPILPHGLTCAPEEDLLRISRDDVPGFCVGPHQPTYQVDFSAHAAAGRVITALGAGVRPYNGSAITPEPLSKVELGERASATATVSGAALPDGEYSVALHATDSLGVTSTWLRPARAPFEAFETPIVVDREISTASITSPTTGDQVCPTFSFSPSGARIASVPIRGSVSDRFLESYTVLIRPAGSGAFTAAGYTHSYPKPIRAGLIDQIFVSQLTAGDYDLDLDVHNGAGSSVCAPPVTVHLSPGIAITGPKSSPALIGSDSLATVRPAQLQFKLNDSGTVRITVDPNTPSAALVFNGLLPAGDASIGWDGTVPGGASVPDGIHVLRVEAVDGCGIRDAKTTQVETLSSSPVARIDSPVPGTTVSGAFELAGEATALHFSSARVFLATSASPDAFADVATLSSPAKGVLASLSLDALAAGGHYILRLEVRDAVGHLSFATTNFTVSPRSIIASLGAVPPVVAPGVPDANGAAVANIGLLVAATVNLVIIDASGKIQSTLLAGAALPAGSSVIPIDPAALSALPDGAFRLQLAATGAGGSETALATLLVDRVAPLVTIVTPLPGAFVAGSIDINGSISDPLLTSWSLTDAPPSASEVQLASGTGAVSGRLATIQGLSEGAHQLDLRAQNAAGIKTVRRVPFASDSVAPVLQLTAPKDGQFVSARAGALAVTATLVEANLASLVLSATEGTPAGPVQQLASLASLPVNGVVSNWDLATIPDGAATLSLLATDLAGNTAAATLGLTVDSTPPAVQIDSPRDGYLSREAAFVGSASDANLLHYTLSIASGPASTAIDFVPVATGTTPVNRTLLAQLGALPADGVYTARLEAVDAAGNSSVDLTSFLVKTVPPDAPKTLSAILRPPSDVLLSWAASIDPATSAYSVQRAQGNAAFAPVATVPAGVVSFTDAALPDGSYRYVVTAIDKAGLTSAPSPVATVVVDTRPPSVLISAPLSNAQVAGLLAIKGSAFKAGAFKGWRLSIGAGATPTQFTTLAQSPAPVVADTLAILDTTTLPQGSLQTLRLEASDVSGNTGSTQVTVTVDNQVPAAPVLLSATAQASTIAIAWQAISPADLGGYLLYRNGALANAPVGSAIRDPLHYLLLATMTSFNDAGLPDGSFSYQLQAVNLAGVASALSNIVSASIRTHVPSATVTSPARFARLPGAIRIEADTPDLDVASVQLQVRAGTADFVPLGAPLTTRPYTAWLDPATLASTVIELRAVATDAFGEIDPSPASLVVFRDPPLTAPAATTLVDGAQATTSLVGADPPSRIAGYLLQRDGASLTAALAAPQPTLTASSTAAGSSAANATGYSGWTSAAGGLQQLDEIFPTQVVLHEVNAAVSPGVAFDLLLRVQGQWVVLASRDVTAPPNFSLPLGGDLSVDGVRLVFASAPPAGVTVTYLTANPVPLFAAVYVDSGLPNGSHAYRAMAESAYGQPSPAALTSANVYAPTLTAPAAAFTSSTAVLAGTQATSGSTVHLSAAGLDIATAIADGAGNFSATVPLQAGGNTFVAIATDLAGNRSLPSSPAKLVYDPIPALTLTLSINSVTGSSVGLGISGSGSPAGVSGLQILRATGTPASVVATLPANATSFSDSSLSNAIYVYTAQAVNADGAAGPLSLPVTVTISAPLPAAPVLTATAVPTGEAIALQWVDTDSAAVRFSLERSASASAGFVPISLSATTTYNDIGLPDLAPLYYRVFALDGAGNRSAASNVASAAPFDSVIPAAPRITAPTVAGVPLVVTSPTVAIEGTADPLIGIELSKNGELVATTTSTADGLHLTPIPTVAPPGTDLAVSASGTLFAYTDFSGMSAAIAIEGGAQRVVATLAGVSLGQPRFSPDGKNILASANGADGSHLCVIDVGSGAVRALLSAALGNETSGSWSPDGSQVVYEAVRTGYSSNVVAVASMTLGTEVVLGSAAPLSLRNPRLLANGDLLAVVTDDNNYNPATLARFSSVGFARTDLISNVEQAPFAVSPSLDLISYRLTNASGLYLLNLSTRAVTQVATRYIQSSAFSPDGGKLALLKGAMLIDYDVASATSLQVGQVLQLSEGSSGGNIYWTAPGQIVFQRQVGVNRISTGSTFRFVSMELTPGDNFFTATAVRQSGNRSVPSGAIQLQLDATSLPDLAVSAVLQPGVPIAGQPANAVVTVRDLGSAAPPPQLSVTVLGSDGSIRTGPLLTLPAAFTRGAAQSMVIPLDLHGLLGPQTLSIIVDPGHLVPDADRGNNSAQVPFLIAPNAGLALAVSIAKSPLAANEDLQTAVILGNPGGPADVVVHLEVDDLAGVPTLALAPDQLLPGIAPGSTTLVSRSVNVGGTLAGDYQVVATAQVAGTVVARAAAPFTIAPDRKLQLTLAAAQARFLSGQDVAVELHLVNASANAMLAGASYHFSITALAGGEVFSSTAALPLLSRGAATDAEIVVPASGLNPGTYDARATILLADGTAIGSVFTPLYIDGQPVLAGSIEVVGATGEPPAVPAGHTLQLHLVASNIGGATAEGVQLQVRMIDPATGLSLVTLPEAVGTLAIAESFTDGLTLSTAGLAIQDFEIALLATQVSAPDAVLLATRRFQITDSNAPVLIATTISDGLFTKGRFAPPIRALDDSSGTAAVRASIDGQPPVPLSLIGGSPLDGTWSAALSLQPDGLHTVVFSAVDAAGNDGLLGPTAANPLTFHIVSDDTPPRISIAGVAPSQLVNAPVTLTFVATDANLRQATATLDGAPFLSGAVVSAEGDHELSVAAVDAAGNQAFDFVRFTIDTTPPAIAVSGASDGEYTNADVDLAVSITDAHPGTSSTLLDGAPFIAALPVVTEGAHTLSIDATDLAGNRAQRLVSFVIDKTAPTISVAGVNDGAFIAGAVSPTFSAIDINLLAVTATLDGASFASGSPINSEGTHSLAVTALDLAGNLSRRTVGFTIDTTPPLISISGVADGALGNQDVTAAFTATDRNLATVSAVLDGASFVSGSVVHAEGTHTLIVVALDLAGNRAQSIATFTIARTPPSISIAGVADGTYLSSDVTPTFTATSLYLSGLAATLDGAPFTSGTLVHAEGAHILLVTASDRAGNSAARSVGFVIDRTAPVIAFAGVTSGGYFNSAVTIVFSATDLNLSLVSSTLDGFAFAAGGVASTEGPHTLLINAVDRAGNRATTTVAFVIDLTPPVLSIGGVRDGAFFNVSVAPIFSASDANLNQVSALLNGAPFVSGTLISIEGIYKLSVSATDLAGNASQRNVSFVIDRTAPVIAIAGVSDGLFSPAASVNPSFAAVDTNLAQVVATLDGAPFVSGTPVSAEGPHQLHVSAIDKAQNSSVREVTFTLDRISPVVSISGVANGTTYSGPVTPLISASDANLSTVAIVLNGAAFSSGTTIGADGSYSLVATATDKAANVTRVSVQFTVLQVKYDVQKHLQGRVPSLLLLVEAGNCAPRAADIDRFSKFLLAAIPSPVQRVAQSKAEFLAGLRSGVYNSFVIAQLPAGQEDCDSGEEEDCDSDDCRRTTSFERELTELTFSGKAGAVLVLATPRHDRRLDELAGARQSGVVDDRTVSFAAPLAPLAALQLLQSGVRLRPALGSAAALYTDDDGDGDNKPSEVAATVHGFALGSAITFGFDPSLGAPAISAQLALARAVGWTVPMQPAPEALGLASIQIDIANLAQSNTTRVRETLGAPLFALQASSPGVIDSGGSLITWQFPLAAGASTALQYFTRLPDKAGTFITSTEVAALLPSGTRIFGNYPLPVTVRQSRSDLEQSAQAAVFLLPSKGSDEHIRGQVLANLSSVAARPVGGKASIEQNLNELLEAGDDVKSLRSVDPTPARLALDELIRYWEARWTVQ